GIVVGDPIGAAMAYRYSGGTYTAADKFTAINSNGKISIGEFMLGYSSLMMYNSSTDAQADVVALSSTAAGFIGAPGPGLFLGPGGSTMVDTYVARAGAGQLSIGSSKLTVGEPTAATDAATKRYADSVAGGSGLRGGTSLRHSY